MANGTTSLSYQIIQLQFTVPAGIQPGVARLRIRCAIGNLTFLANHDSNCESGSLGENSLNDGIGQPLFWWNSQSSLLNWRNIPMEFMNHSAFVYDLKGAIVCIFNVNSESSSMGIPIQPDGIYLLRISSKTDCITQKLVLRSAE